MLATNHLEVLGKVLIVAGVVSIASSLFFWQNRGQAHSEVPPLASIQQRGYIKCGVASNRPGLSVINTESRVTTNSALSPDDQKLTLYTDSIGLEADMCRAVSIGLFGTDEDHLYFHVADGNWNSRMNSIVDGTIDILFRQAAIQPEMGTTHPVDHGPVVYFERIVLLAAKTQATANDSGLSGKRICAIANSFSETIAREYTQRLNRGWVFADNFNPPAKYRNYSELLDALLSGQCDAIAGRFATLHTGIMNRNTLKDFHLLSLPKSTPVPTVGVVSSKAYLFNQLASHAIWTLLRAEASEQTAETVPLDFNSSYWILQGLDSEYPARIIQQLGNYSEIYQRHFGATLPDAGPNTHYSLTTEGRLIAPK